LMLSLMAIGHRTMRMAYVSVHRRNFHRVRRRKRCKDQRKSYNNRYECAHWCQGQDTSASIMEKYLPMSIASTTRRSAGWLVLLNNRPKVSLQLSVPVQLGWKVVSQIQM